MNPVHLKPDQKIVFFGCGSVAKCCIHYLNHFIKCKMSQVTIIDKNKTTKIFPSVKQAIKKGAHFIHLTIDRNNLVWLLDTKLKLSKYDLVIDLTTNTSTYNILKECRMRSLLYINTSIEDDENNLTEENTCPTNSGIFLQHLNLQAIAEKTKDYNNVTSLIEFGMNPGLISVFVKQGIMNLSKMVIDAGKADKKMIKAYNEKNHKALAESLDIQVIHCSEIDTQLPQKIDNNKFINTWSCVGLITEGVEPAEIQMGTHENKIPFAKSSVSQILPQLLITKQAGKDIKFQSIAPLMINNDNSVQFTKFTGRCIHHGEGISLNRYLGSFKYAPTMHYVYQLNPHTENLLDNLSKREMISITKDDNKWKVLNVYEDKISGYDNVGALFMMKKNPITGSNKPFYFWTGSICDTKYTKNVLKDTYFGPTVIQVMAGVLSGAKWILKNKNRGLCFGEDINDNYIIKHSKKYLGRYYSGPVTDNIALDGHTLDKLITKKSGTVKIDEL
jgi:homospermidine synthase